MKAKIERKKKKSVRMKADLVVEGPIDQSNIIKSCKILSSNGMS